MQSDYPAHFVRDMGCSEVDLRSCLPGACRHAPILWRPQGADVSLSSGTLELRWQALEDRRIALIRLPRLQVSFNFGDVDANQRQAFMKHFDLYTQRGGG